MRFRKGLQGLLRQEEAVTLGAFLKRPELRQIEAVQTPPPFDRQIETTSGLFSFRDLSFCRRSSRKQNIDVCRRPLSRWDHEVSVRPDEGISTAISEKVDLAV